MWGCRVVVYPHSYPKLLYHPVYNGIISHGPWSSNWGIRVFPTTHVETNKQNASKIFNHRNLHTHPLHLTDHGYLDRRKNPNTIMQLEPHAGIKMSQVLRSLTLVYICGFTTTLSRPLTAKLRWRLFSSVPHASDRLELHNNRASWILHPGPSESDVYSDVVQEARSNDLLHTARLLMRLDMPLHGNNARGAQYAVYYASIATHTVFENIKWLRSELCRIRNFAVPSLASLFPALSNKWAKNKQTNKKQNKKQTTIWTQLTVLLDLLTIICDCLKRL